MTNGRHTPPPLTPEFQHLLAALEWRDAQKAADSVSMDKVATRAKSLREIAVAAFFFASLVAGAVLTFKELQDKPTKVEVESAIESHKTTEAHPVTQEATKKLTTDVESIKEDVETVKEVQDYQIEQAAWQGDVLEHVAAKKRGPAPQKPESLKVKERKLLSK